MEDQLIDDSGTETHQLVIIQLTYPLRKIRCPKSTPKETMKKIIVTVLAIGILTTSVVMAAKASTAQAPLPVQGFVPDQSD
jgi:hypothetical protein